MIYKAKAPFVKKEFARRLRQLRRSIHATQQDLADTLNISRRTYVEWESINSSACPQDPAKIVSLCEILNTNPSYLLSGVFEEKREKIHEERYLGLYDRYRNNADFHLLIRMLMELDDDYIKVFANFAESLYDKLTEEKTQR